MSEGKIHALKKTAELEPEQAELVAALRGLVDRALSGEVIGLVGLVVASDADADMDYMIAGRIWSQGDVFMGLHNMADMVRLEHIEGMLGLEDDEE